MMKLYAVDLSQLQWNQITITFFVLGVIFLAGSFTFLIISLVHNHLKRKQSSLMMLNTSNVRIYNYNLKESTIRYFEKRNMRDQRVTTADGFFNSFSDRKDAERVKSWIKSYVDGNGTQSAFLTVKTHISDMGKECLSIYRITDYNAKRQIIHFENTVLPEISVKRTRHDKELSYIKKLHDVEQYVTGGKKTRPCVCYYILLIPYVNGSADKLDTQRTLYVTSIYQPLNNVQKYLSKKRNLVLINDKSAAIFDFDQSYRTDIISFCNTILAEIARYFSIKDLSGLYQIAMGVSIYEGKGTFEDTVFKAKGLASEAAKKENVSFLIEGEEQETPMYSDSSSLEINSLIANKTFRCYFTPVLSLELDNPTYLINIMPYGINNSSFRYLIDACSKADKVGPLFEAVLSSLEDYSLTKNQQKAIVSIPVGCISDFLFIAKEKPEAKNFFIPSFSAEEVQDFFEADMDVEKSFSLLKEAGFAICLSFANADVDTPAEILNLFDLFCISPLEPASIHQNEEKTSLLISCFSVLKAYNKPIIIGNLPSAADITLAYELGFSSFVSPTLAGASSIPYGDPTWKDKVFGDNQEMLRNFDDDDEDDVKGDRDDDDDDTNYFGQ